MVLSVFGASSPRGRVKRIQVKGETSFSGATWGIELLRLLQAILYVSTFTILFYKPSLGKQMERFRFFQGEKCPPN